MAETTIPYNAVDMVAWSEETLSPGQTSEITQSGRRYIVDTGVRVRRGTVTFAALESAGDVNEAAFLAWHRSLRGDDNQVSLQPVKGKYATPGSTEVVTAAITWSSIADEALGGSTVVLGYTPADADLTSVLIVGARLTILGRQVEITSVTTAPASGAATVVVTPRLPAQTPINETQLTFDYTPRTAAFGMGAVEAVAGELIVPVNDAAGAPILARADVATGTPDLTTPVGTLRDAGGATWFPTPHGVSGIAYLNDGRYFVSNAFANTVAVIVGANGQLVTGQDSDPARSFETALLIATSSSAVIPGSNAGAALLGGYVYVIDTLGRINRVALANLTNPQAGAFTGIGARGSLDYMQAEPVGRIAGNNTTDVAGMWTSPSGLTVLRQITGGAWRVSDLAIAGSVVTPTDRYAPTTRPFRGGTEIARTLYASANNRINRYTVAPSLTVDAGLAATSIRVNLLASGVQLQKQGSSATMTATYPWEEIV